MYCDKCKIFEKNLQTYWDNVIKPLILQKFPLKQQGFRTINSDFDFLIKQIELQKEKYSIKEITIENLFLEKDNNDNNNNINNNLETKKVKVNAKEERRTNSEGKIITEKKKDDILNHLNKENNNVIKEKEDIKVLRENNISKIQNFLENFIKRTNSMKNLRRKTITSITTCSSSAIEDNNNNMNNNMNIIKGPIENIILKQNLSVIKEEPKNDKKQKLKPYMIGGSISLIRELIVPKYKDDHEIEGDNIIFKDGNNKLDLLLIHPNILLKKIIFDDFLYDDKYILLINHFCQQCFSFVNKEIFFKKIFDCYNFYINKKKKTINEIKNLIDFLNVLVIEMFRYYEEIEYNEIHIKLLYSFYRDLLSHLLTTLDFENEENDDNEEIEEDEEKEKKHKDNDSFSEKEEKEEEEDEEEIKTKEKKNKSKKNNEIKITRENLILLNLNLELKAKKIEKQLKNFPKRKHSKDNNSTKAPKKEEKVNKSSFFSFSSIIGFNKRKTMPKPEKIDIKPKKKPVSRFNKSNSRI